MVKQNLSWLRLTLAFLGRCSSQISIAGPDRLKENNLKTALETPKFTSDLFQVPRPRN